MVKQRTAIYERIDALLELLGPAWFEAIGSAYGKAALALLSRYADPTVLLRLGQARLVAFLARHSHGVLSEQKAVALIAAARTSIDLWGPAGIDFGELAADIAAEAQQAQALSAQIDDLDERIGNLYAEADPQQIVISAPGVGPVLAGVITGRLGDPRRFKDLAAVRAYSGLVPRTNQSGVGLSQHGLTKAGDALLRSALYTAADGARKIDPQLAAKYVRLMTGNRHHVSAMCHIAAILLVRIAHCQRTGQPYVLRDTDGRPISTAEGRAIVKACHTVPKEVRKARTSLRRSQTHKNRTGREQQESHSAPTTRPAKPDDTTTTAA